MSHRTQITLTDEQYARLKDESSRSGVGLAELVRRAIDGRYGTGTRDVDEAVAALDATFGLWKDRDLDSVEYVRSLRGPGVGYRLRELGLD